MITKHAELLKRLPHFLYKPLAQAYIDRDFPRHLFIETTSNCNLACAYCPREKITNNMDYGVFQKVVDEATGYGARSFSLHLFGEPLLYPKIFEAIRYIKSKNIRHTVLLTTNGTRIDSLINELLRSPIDRCIWSWRPEAKWSDETEQKLKRWKPFTIRMIREVTPKKIREKYKSWRNVEVRSLHTYGGQVDTSRWNAPPAPKRYPCYHLWLSPAVAWNGNILLCCADPKQKEVIGRFPRMSVHQAWTSPKIKMVRNAHLEGKYEGICKNCDTWKAYPDLGLKKS